MGRIPVRVLLALILCLTLASGGVSLQTSPEIALAADETVAVCDEEAFDDALDEVQDSGGGMITFTCTGTIDFSGPKAITSNVTIIGNGGVILDGAESTRIFAVSPGRRLELIGLTLRNGWAGGNTDGGAIANFGTLVINASTFSNNHATGQGGAISNAVAGTLTIAASTFNGNSAAAHGGAIYNGTGRTATITASTFSGNTAGAGSAGGAVINLGTLTVTASTLSGNSASVAAGALFMPSGTAEVGASILANNSSSGGNCFGAITSLGSNLSNDTSCTFNATGDQQGAGVTVNLGPLADNGGPTFTMLPLPGSAAIDSADCGLSSTEDQRGVERPVGPACDIGAVEVRFAIPSVDIPEISPSPSNEGQSVDLSAAFTDASDHTPDSCTIDWGDGAAPQDGNITFDDGAGVCEGSHSYADDDAYTVTIEVCNADRCDQASTGHTVTNVAPTVNTPQVNPSPSNEGQAVIASATFSDPGSLDTHTCAVDYGDGDGPQEGVVTGTTCTGPEHTYIDDDEYTVTIVVTDNAGDFDSNSTQHSVNNVAPAVDTPEVDPSPSNEGQSVVASATFSDPGILDTHTCTVDYGDGSGPQDGMIEDETCTGPEHTYVDDHPDGYEVTVEVCDNGGDCGQAGLTHTVLNLPPVIEEITTNSPAPQGEPVTVTVIASDPGILDVLSYSFDCDSDGDFEIGPQESNTADCPLDPSAAVTIITVMVEETMGTLPRTRSSSVRR